MKTTRVFMSGNSQVVRLPKEFRIEADQVEILKRGDETILRPVRGTLEAAFHALLAFPADVFDPERIDLPPQDREGL